MCNTQERLVDSATELAKAPIKRKTVKDMSTYQMSYYVDVRKLYSSINDDQSFSLLSHSCQSLGAVSIVTGNDKSLSLRFIGKNTTLENDRSGCSEGKVQDLVNSNGKFVKDEHCEEAFKRLIGLIYSNLYRAKLRQLEHITWNALISTGNINLSVLRDIGNVHFKGNLEKTIPVPGVLNPMFL